MGIHGEGTVGYDKAKGCYYARVPVGKLPNGKTKYVRRSARTKAEAQKIRRSLLNERDNPPIEPIATKVTFYEFAQRHLEGEARNEVREVTRLGYLYLLNKVVYPVFGSTPIQDIRSPEISQFLVGLRNGSSASTVNHTRAAMSRVFQAALIHQIINDNPMRRTKRMRAKPGDRTLSQQPWTLDECRTAMEKAVGTEMDLFVHLAILTGARLGEMLGLQWSDINLESQTLTIQRTLTELRGTRHEGGGKGIPTFGPPKTAKSVRTLTFGQPLANALDRHRRAQATLKERAGVEWVESGCVFTSTNGKPVWVSNFSARFRRFLKSNDLRHVNVHSIRHSFSINALALGVDLASISRALGHASLQITLDIYAKESKDLQNRATEGLSAWFES
jgi:integrase